MLYEGIRELKSEELPKGDKKLPVKTLIMQAIATSIDALVIGVSFAALGVNIIQASLIIGIVTFICCMICSVLGNRFGRYIRKYATIFGGIPADYHRHQDTYRASGRLSASQPSTCITKSTDKQQIR